MKIKSKVNREYNPEAPQPSKIIKSDRAIYCMELRNVLGLKTFKTDFDCDHSEKCFKYCEIMNDFPPKISKAVICTVEGCKGNCYYLKCPSRILTCIKCGKEYSEDEFR